MEYIAELNNYLEYSLDDNHAEMIYLSIVLACMSFMLQWHMDL